MTTSQTPFHLSGKTILITGASSGIGRATAIACSKLGASCILTGRNDERLHETQKQLLGEGHFCIAADLTQTDDREKLMQQMPTLDGLVWCAGVVNPFPIRFLDEQKIRETFSINYDAVVLTMASMIKHKKLNRNASLVFMSSISAAHPHKGGALYGSSKIALETFSKTLALELYPQKIRSNCIAAAMVQTPMYEQAEERMSKEEMDKHVSRYPLGTGKPEDVAHAAIYFLSDASAWVTGTSLTLDGGFLLHG